MIISNSQRFIFFHIPKSGGTSLTRLFDAGLCWNDVIVGGTKSGEIFQREWARRFQIFKHSTPEQLHKVVGDDIFGNYYKFLFVRDPIKRFKSSVQFLYQVVTEKRDWILTVYSTDHLNEIAGLKSVRDSLNSDFFRAIRSKAFSDCNEIEKWFKPQFPFYEYLLDHYAESSAFYKLENLRESLRDLTDRRLTSLEHIEASEILTKKRNVSKRLLSEDLSSSDMTELVNIFSRDVEVFEYEC